jgi:NAD(P)-dependent dehydrogenase (short-subunit alcohol dehydrogenase family)
MLLAKKVVVVTGAGMGVGAAIAKMAAQHGAHVVVNDAGVTATGEGRDPTVAQGVVDEIIARGGVAIASVRDVSDWDDAHGIIKDAVDAFGRVDVVVNNAGIVRDNMSICAAFFMSLARRLHIFGRKMAAVTCT